MNILRAYRERYPDEEVSNGEEEQPSMKRHAEAISDSSFLKLVSTLTFNDMRSATAVDYATGILLYDNFNMVKIIIRTIDNDTIQRSFIVKAEKVVNSKHC